MASSGENTNAAITPIPVATTTTTNRIALTTLDNALATAASGGGAVLVAEIQISPANNAGGNSTNTTTIIKAANNPPGTTTVQAVAQQMRLSPLQSAHATNSSGGRDITSSGSGVMTGNLTKSLTKFFYSKKLQVVDNNSYYRFTDFTAISNSTFFFVIHVIFHCFFFKV